MIVVDASVLLPALMDPEFSGAAAWDRLTGDSLAAPELIDIEVASGLKRLERGHLVSPDTAVRKLAELTGFPLERFPHTPFLPRIWELRHNLSTYEASYVALAEMLGATLLSSDRSFVEAPGIGCPVELLA